MAKLNKNYKLWVTNFSPQDVTIKTHNGMMAHISKCWHAYNVEFVSYISKTVSCQAFYKLLPKSPVCLRLPECYFSVQLPVILQTPIIVDSLGTSYDAPGVFNSSDAGGGIFQIIWSIPCLLVLWLLKHQGISRHGIESIVYATCKVAPL